MRGCENVLLVHWRAVLYYKYILLSDKQKQFFLLAIKRDSTVPLLDFFMILSSINALHHFPFVPAQLDSWQRPITARSKVQQLHGLCVLFLVIRSTALNQEENEGHTAGLVLSHSKGRLLWVCPTAVVDPIYALNLSHHEIFISTVMKGNFLLSN